jgi:hypothetical protein
MEKAKVGQIVKQARGISADCKSTSIHKKAEFIHNFSQELRSRNKN